MLDAKSTLNKREAPECHAETPEHALWTAVLATYFRSIQLPSCTLKRAESLLEQAASPWTRHVCALIGLEWSWFYNLLNNEKKTRFPCSS